MSRDVVIVPTYERPEYAWLCLEYLSRARGIENREVWLWQDSHKGGLEVDPMNAPEDTHALGHHLNRLFGSRALYNCPQYPRISYGNSENLLSGLCRAYDYEALRIYLVEDDIMVSPDFFEWHDRMLHEVRPFVSCASALNKSAHFQINGPDRMDESIKDPSSYKQVIGPYSSHAVAFKRDNLGYLLNHFRKNNFVGRPGYEQDLATQDYLRERKARSVWPYVPRAYNVGMRSYHINTGMPILGTLEQKVEALRKIIVDPEKLRSMSCNNLAITPVPVFNEAS